MFITKIWTSRHCKHFDEAESEHLDCGVVQVEQSEWELDADACLLLPVEVECCSRLIRTARFHALSKFSLRVSKSEEKKKEKEKSPCLCSYRWQKEKETLKQNSLVVDRKNSMWHSKNLSFHLLKALFWWKLLFWVLRRVFVFFVCEWRKQHHHHKVHSFDMCSEFKSHGKGLILFVGERRLSFARCGWDQRKAARLHTHSSVLWHKRILKQMNGLSSSTFPEISFFGAKKKRKKTKEKKKERILLIQEVVLNETNFCF